MEESIRIYEPFWDEWQLSEALYKDGNTCVYLIHRQQAEDEKHILKRVSIPDTEDRIKYLEEQGLGRDDIRERINAIARKVYSAYLKALAAGFDGMLGYESCLIYAERGAARLSYDLLIKAEQAVPLSERVMEEALSEDEVTRLGVEIGGALSVLHGRGIVYGCLRPESVFICADGRFVLDEPFIQKAFIQTAGPDTPACFDLTGCAPEVAAGAEPDEISDVYSLGLLLYRMTGGKRRKDTLTGWIMRLCSRHRELRPGLPEFLDAMRELPGGKAAESEESERIEETANDQPRSDGSEYVGNYQPDYAFIDFGKRRRGHRLARIIALTAIVLAAVAAIAWFVVTTST